MRLAFVGGAVALATLPGGSVALAAGDGEFLYAALFPAGLVAFSVWMLLGPLWAWDVAGRLDRARRLEAEVAVKDERLRFAADLHDIQGHHLQVIALKSELAARLAERDPARAAAEMRDVRQLAADALHDTRAVVHGYRSTTLDDEIANATRVLAAADIDARMTLDPAAVAAGRAAPARHLLGLVVREATTNVLRHSSARRAEVDYRLAGGLARLRFSNDGASEPSAASRPSGSGLPGLAERLRAMRRRADLGPRRRPLRGRRLAAGPGERRRPVIRLLLADDEDLLRSALAALLALEDDLDVVAEAATATDAVLRAREHRPDIAVLDLEMPPTDGLTAAGEIRAELPTQVVIVTRHARPAVLRRALAAGVRGFVPKTTPAARLAEIVRDVAMRPPLRRPGHRRRRADRGRLPAQRPGAGGAACGPYRRVGRGDRRRGAPRARDRTQLPLRRDGQTRRELAARRRAPGLAAGLDLSGAPTAPARG